VAATGLWEGVDRLLERLDPERIDDHGLGALGARRLRLSGEPVPDGLAWEERAARTAALVAPTLLARVRDAYDGPLLLIKGPTLARRYPDGARRFGDLDLLPANPETAQASLLAAGFRLRKTDVPVQFYDLEDHHHLHPLEWPGLGLPVEVHRRVMWPRGLRPPSNAELFEAAVPAEIGVEGLLVPDPRHHALLLAAHSWSEEPLRKVRDLVDVLTFADDETRDELARLARSWGFDRGWNSTLAAADWLLRDCPEPRFVRVWARYLKSLREPTVAEMHVRAWLSPFSMAPTAAAFRLLTTAILRDLKPLPYESWPTKLRRTAQAVLHPVSPRSLHHGRVGRGRRPMPEADGTGSASE